MFGILTEQIRYFSCFQLCLSPHGNTVAQIFGQPLEPNIPLSPAPDMSRVFTPTTCPREFTRGPPELPLFIWASWKTHLLKSLNRPGYCSDGDGSGVLFRWKKRGTREPMPGPVTSGDALPMVWTIQGLWLLSLLGPIVPRARATPPSGYRCPRIAVSMWGTGSRWSFGGICRLIIGGWSPFDLSP